VDLSDPWWQTARERRGPRADLPLGEAEPAIGTQEAPGELPGLGYRVGLGTIRQILAPGRIAPPPREADTSWRTFPRAPAAGPPAADYFHIDTVWLQRPHLPVVIKAATGRVHLPDATAHPTPAWVAQQARHMVMDLDEPITSFRFLIRDRDTKSSEKYSETFDPVLSADGAPPVNTPPRTPRANRYLQRRGRSMRQEGTDHLLTYREQHATTVHTDYARHFNDHRPHHGRAPLPPHRSSHAAPIEDTVRHKRPRRKPLLAGVINQYRRAA
jgi:hypothetical protein